MRDRSQARCVLVQPQVATVLMIVADVSSHEPDEMTCTENHDVLKELATAVADPPLRGSVLPWAAKRSANGFCARCFDELDDRSAKDEVAIEDEIFRSGVVGKCLTQLLNNPSRRRVERGVEVNDVPTAVLDDEEAVQQPERSGGHGEQIHGGDIVFMVAQESHPSFQLVGLRGTPRQVSRHRDLGDDETELGELSMDAWRPQPFCAIVRTRRRISASIRGRPGWRRCEIFAQYRRNRSRCQRATVSAWTMSRRLAHTGHEPRRATQKARSVSSSGGRGRSFFSAVTCCRKATFSNTRSARRRHIARMARTPSETRKTTTLSIAAEFRRLRPGIQAERKSLISWAEQF